MKLDELRSIGHNVAASLADGCSLLLGCYDLDIFGEVATSRDAWIEIDFLSGTYTGAACSPVLADAIKAVPEALAGLCGKHHSEVSAFRCLSARYAVSPARFSVVVEDWQGRRVLDEYLGFEGRRVRTLDPLGRVRRKVGRVDMAPQMLLPKRE